MLVHISQGNRKVGNVPSVSLVPIKDCGNCELCKRDCYYLKAWRQYPAVRTACRENSAMAHDHRDEYFAQIRGYLARKRPRFFRWHVAGDVLDQHYLDCMATVAALHPYTRFLVFTKMHHLNFTNLPSNLQAVISRWPRDVAPSGRGTEELRAAWMQDGAENRIPDSAIQCPGHCDGCMKCWDLAARGHDVWFRRH